MASDSSWTNSSRGVVNGIVKLLPFRILILTPEPQMHRISAVRRTPHARPKAPEAISLAARHYRLLT
jgi:hypothetical protein